ncbi:N-acetylmuramoyl-L-alanine amidase [Mangrovibacterium marinum]|uniref:N-acetylmuramoyl-L-alanine amidase n=1 Tax=Mangrovibacterium marinum TaxID=1639118 RepID=A0A2T5BZN6_9BACT|nr:N-acetylmuramoyl-L-alanine amidase [Mangrovibacterium marinum]PTN07760.1 N-acetylmuramoyl-L-alanine amidase [Mangrovibacterium marinum]
MRNAAYFLAFIVVILVAAPVKIQAKSISKKKFTIVIDPGHGGHDPGAMYQRIKEKNIVLNLAIKLGRYIDQEMPDAAVIYTRNSDVFIPLHKRAEKAISSKADLFLSIHANSCASPSVSGTETFVLGMHRTKENLEVAKKENAVILIEDDYSTRYQGFDPNSSESYIIFDLVQEEYFAQSLSAAALVQNQFKNQARRTDRGVKQAGFLVLRETSTPSILIEVGYLSNKQEAAYLNSEKGQSELAKAICQAVKTYKTNYEQKSDIALVPLVENETAIGKAMNPDQPTSKPEKHQSNKQTSTSAKAPPQALYYAVQIAVTHQKLALRPDNFKGLENIHIQHANGLYKYYYCKETDWAQIEVRKNEARKAYKDAFITAFFDGKQISLDQARKLTER